LGLGGARPRRFDGLCSMVVRSDQARPRMIDRR
jgi:hypothetical protein